MSRRRRRRKPRPAVAIAGSKSAELAAEQTERNPYPWLIQGLQSPRTRGVDERNTVADLNAKQIDAERHRDPVIFRAVDYYDKLPLGTGITLESENDTVLMAAQRFWRANNFDQVQHMIAIELAQTATIVGWLPKDVRPDGVETLEYVPSFELIPTGQVDRIATKNGKLWYFRREWEDREYPEPEPEAKRRASSLIGAPVIMSQDLLAEDVVYMAINRGAQELRGASMLTPALYWTKLYSRTLKMIYVHSIAKAWLALHIKVSGMNEGDPNLEALKEKVEGTLLNQLDPSGEEYKALGSGQALITGQNAEVNVLASKVGADSQDDEKRRLLLQAAVSTGLPEVFLSDGDYANLASSMTQSNPFFRLMLSHQKSLLDFFRLVFEKAFDRYRAAGWFEDVALPPGKTHIVDLLKISAPEILTPDVAVLGPITTQLVDSEMISRRTAANMLGLNWEEEKTQIEAERLEGFKPKAPPVMGLPFSALGLATNGESETREETETVAEKMARKSAAATKEFAKAMEKLGATKDRQAALAAFTKYRKKARAILTEALEAGRKVGVVDGGKEAEKLPAIEEEELATV